MENSNHSIDTENLVLRYWPDLILRAVCKPINLSCDERVKVSRKMTDIMFENRGLGLAAPQVGIDQRLFVMRDPDASEDSGEALTFVNPVIIDRSKKTCAGPEGCLSTPGVKTTIVRSTWVDVQFLEMPYCDNILARHFEDLDARCIQHEMDHLNGIMFFDHINGNLPKKLLLGRYEKYRRKM